MRPLPLAASLAFLLLTACIRPVDGDSTATPSSGPGVVLSAERSGDAVTLTLTNGSGSAIGYNLCSSALLRRDGATWRTVQTDLVCTMELRSLQPGQQDTFDYPIPSGLPPADYAWSNNIELPLGGTRNQVVSNAVRLP